MFKSILTYVAEKIVYIGLDEVCQLVSKNDNIELD